MDPGSLEAARWVADAGASAVLVIAIGLLISGRVVTKERLAETRADCARERQEDQAEIDRLRTKLDANEQATREMAQAALDALKHASATGKT